MTVVSKLRTVWNRSPATTYSKLWIRLFGCTEIHAQVYTSKWSFNTTWYQIYSLSLTDTIGHKRSKTPISSFFFQNVYVFGQRSKGDHSQIYVANSKHCLPSFNKSKKQQKQTHTCSKQKSIKKHKPFHDLESVTRLPKLAPKYKCSLELTIIQNRNEKIYLKNTIYWGRRCLISFRYEL